MQRIKKFKWVISMIIVLTLIIVFVIALLRFSDEPKRKEMDEAQHSMLQ
ncbi:hypothetical protein BMS3Abin04_02876 [bacterium BMS3Abin04]|nr:hypothetical protein BMS3Abin04_02876 [bacterium BMS3Abin04]